MAKKNKTANLNKALMPACRHKSQPSRQAKELNLPTHSQLLKFSQQETIKNVNI